MSYEEDDLGEGSGSSEGGVGSISFSGKDGEYSWKDEEGNSQSAMELEVVFGFEMLNGRTLWSGSGPIPEDGSQPLCRSESAGTPCAGLRPQVNPVTLSVMIAGGWTGDCSDCKLDKFNGDQKPLCKRSASLFVAFPSDSPPQLRRIAFTNWSSTKALDEKIKNLKNHCRTNDVNVRTLVLKLGSEKVAGKKKGDSYRIPTLSIVKEKTVDEGFAAALKVEAQLLVADLRKRPSWAKDPKLVLRAPETQAAITAAAELDGISVEEIPF